MSVTKNKRPSGKTRAKRAVAKRGVSGRGAKNKGSNYERECVEYLKSYGIHAERVPLSGAAGGSYSGDIDAYIGRDNPIHRKLECKIRKRAWSDLYGWLKGNYALLIRANLKETLVVLPLKDFCELMGEKW